MANPEGTETDPEEQRTLAVKRFLYGEETMFITYASGLDIRVKESGPYFTELEVDYPKPHGKGIWIARVSLRKAAAEELGKALLMKAETMKASELSV